MHEIEPHFLWRDYYIASEDPNTPFYGREYSEFEFTNTIYNFVVHPQWDEFGSKTLYLKILYADYEEQYCVIELFGEWNDALYNDIMMLKREVIDVLLENGIKYFILIGENVLNFHYSDDCYYEEWFEELEDDGWIVGVNFHEHVEEEFRHIHLDYFMALGGDLDEQEWRQMMPEHFFKGIRKIMRKRLN